jgi:DNA-binding response OmpR family regulator
MPNTILIIDDNAEFTSSLQIQLEMEGYTVASALSSIAGWKEMERCQPDIILLDWEMTEMSGIELIKLIKANIVHRRRYIIMITGYSGTKNIVQGLDAGADDYLVKHFELDELLARIRSGLRIRSLEERISEETRRSTMLDMALSLADKIGNPIAAARIYQQLLMKNTDVSKLAEVSGSIKTIGDLLDEAINLIDKFNSIKPEQSPPAQNGETIIP